MDEIFPRDIIYVSLVEFVTTRSHFLIQKNCGISNRVTQKYIIKTLKATVILAFTQSFLGLQRRKNRDAEIINSFVIRKPCLGIIK